MAVGDRQPPSWGDRNMPLPSYDELFALIAPVLLRRGCKIMLFTEAHPYAN